MSNPTDPTEPTNPPPFDRETFAWITQRGSEIAQLVALVPTRGFGLQLLGQLVRYADTLYPQPAADRRQAATEERGRLQAADQRTRAEYWLLWREIHVRALTRPAGLDDTPFLESVSVRLSACVVKRCRQNFDAYRQENPPDFSTQEKYFAWTVALHNHVNTHKTPATRAWTVDEARAFWLAAPPEPPSA